ncbi:proteic killer suppression protein [Tessaracoccus bendigoensis DSM 12906]|uniref:Proteic killer suppression protein n=1 Tax=Tessaracoccus bendigoensis DSM 12906 TaxID=1123357 RepID=A0A1M6MB80_9ACTN|nr:type II toxin-antitoxin system RelE/ParE family toxin [Tessaracoccus bendigoensis]SHJ80620.1 proteic killer suppression protein [Tessaracoccus bendigoensis DSM 12906]
MRLRYSSRQLEKECTDERGMKRRRGALAAKLRLRVNALEVAESMTDLQAVDPLGKWHPLTADRAGRWAGRLSANWRLIVEPAGDEPGMVTALVIDIEDYH